MLLNPKKAGKKPQKKTKISSLLRSKKMMNKGDKDEDKNDISHRSGLPDSP